MVLGGVKPLPRRYHSSLAYIFWNDKNIIATPVISSKFFNKSSPMGYPGCRSRDASSGVYLLLCLEIPWEVGAGKADDWAVWIGLVRLGWLLAWLPEWLVAWLVGLDGWAVLCGWPRPWTGFGPNPWR